MKQSERTEQGRSERKISLFHALSTVDSWIKSDDVYVDDFGKIGVKAGSLLKRFIDKMVNNYDNPPIGEGSISNAIVVALGTYVNNIGNRSLGVPLMDEVEMIEMELIVNKLLTTT